MLRQTKELDENISAENTQVKASAIVFYIWLNKAVQMKNRMCSMEGVCRKLRVNITGLLYTLKSGISSPAGLLHAYVELIIKAKQQKYLAVSHQAYRSGLINIWEAI